MQFEKISASTRPPSPPTKPRTSSGSETLTASELQSLGREMTEDGDYLRKAFRKTEKAA